MKQIHLRLDEFAQRFLCGRVSLEPLSAEYATDIVFHRQADLTAIYEALALTATHSVKLDHMANP